MNYHKGLKTALKNAQIFVISTFVHKGDIFSLKNVKISANLVFFAYGYFPVGTALVFLLQQPDLLPSPAQRLCAVTILHELYRGEPPPNNPFLPVFVNILVSKRLLVFIDY